MNKKWTIQAIQEYVTKNGKTKFTPDGENTVTQWIKDNMMVLYVPNNDYEEDELKLINQYNPPLNLKDNYNEIKQRNEDEWEKEYINKHE